MGDGRAVLDPIDAWLRREISAGRLRPKPTIDQLSQVARLLADVNGNGNGNGHATQRQLLETVTTKRRRRLA